jgi:hypothetical protein
MIKKIKILIVTVFLTAFGGVTYASFTDGLNAAIEGDYKTALKEWQSLADQGNASAQYNFFLQISKKKSIFKYILLALYCYKKINLTRGKICQYQQHNPIHQHQTTHGPTLLVRMLAQTQ